MALLRLWNFVIHSSVGDDFEIFGAKSRFLFSICEAVRRIKKLCNERLPIVVE